VDGRGHPADVEPLWMGNSSGPAKFASQKSLRI
jgi:hypothetical protein